MPLCIHSHKDVYKHTYFVYIVSMDENFTWKVFNNTEIFPLTFNGSGYFNKR